MSYNLGWVENKYQEDGVAPRSRDKSPVSNIIKRGSIRDQNATELQQIPPKRKGISWAEFVFQIFITIEGPAVFILPATFKNVGYLLGILGTVGIAIFYMYLMRILSWCDEYMQKKRKLKQQSLYSLITNIFDEYKYPRVGSWLNFYLKYEIILSWTMGLSFGLFFANKNVQLILAYFHIQTTDQFVLLILSIPTMLICWFPHIQSIAFFSYFITIIIAAVMLEVMYYLLINPVENPRVLMINDVSTLPDFLFMMFYVITYTALVFPLKLEMKYPSNLKKLFGGINLSIILIAVLNIFFCLLVYFKLGDEVQDNILSNLPNNEIVLVTNCLFVVGLMGSGALSFYLIFQTLWFDGWDSYFKKSNFVKFYEYVVRSMLGIFIIILAMVIPTFNLFINLISCFSYPYDSVLLPIILESVIVWNDKQNTTTAVLILIKNITIGVLCVLACLLAFYISLLEILSVYQT
ncbi:proton-coupled amino acid transporter 3-like [Planococcus citri]|uniref:proton-coupled amino acid transporter 3-like n=1 Tax=Planococcus citri TaxID=170843 RepID=UPI0031F8B133